ncbi:MAG: hypothetical protein DHS20C10_12280 [marine bacterium B5-7]|nr:MAG: hypothetical protein DHS20C10_12280 [marine bacterium B5-7]
MTFEVTNQQLKGLAAHAEKRDIPVISNLLTPLRELEATPPQLDKANHLRMLDLLRHDILIKRADNTSTSFNALVKAELSEEDNSALKKINSDEQVASEGSSSDSDDDAASSTGSVESLQDKFAEQRAAIYGPAMKKAVASLNIAPALQAVILCALPQAQGNVSQNETNSLIFRFANPQAWLPLNGVMGDNTHDESDSHADKLLLNITNENTIYIQNTKSIIVPRQTTGSRDTSAQQKDIEDPITATQIAALTISSDKNGHLNTQGSIKLDDKDFSGKHLNDMCERGQLDLSRIFEKMDADVPLFAFEIQLYQNRLKQLATTARSKVDIKNMQDFIQHVAARVKSDKDATHFYGFECHFYDVFYRTLKTANRLPAGFKFKTNKIIKRGQQQYQYTHELRSRRANVADLLNFIGDATPAKDLQTVAQAIEAESTMTTAPIADFALELLTSNTDDDSTEENHNAQRIVPHQPTQAHTESLRRLCIALARHPRTLGRGLNATQLESFSAQLKPHDKDSKYHASLKRQALNLLVQAVLSHNPTIFRENPALLSDKRCNTETLALQLKHLKKITTKDNRQQTEVTLRVRSAIAKNDTVALRDLLGLPVTFKADNWRHALNLFFRRLLRALLTPRAQQLAKDVTDTQVIEIAKRDKTCFAALAKNEKQLGRVDRCITREASLIGKLEDAELDAYLCRTEETVLESRIENLEDGDLLARLGLRTSELVESCLHHGTQQSLSRLSQIISNKLETSSHISAESDQSGESAHSAPRSPSRAQVLTFPDQHDKTVYSSDSDEELDTRFHAPPLSTKKSKKPLLEPTTTQPAATAKNH